MLKRYLLGFTFLISLPSLTQVTRCQLPVAVVDKEHELLSALSPTDLSLKIEGQAVEISAVEKRAPQNVILLLDTSTEMARFRSERKDQLLLLYWLASSAPNNVSLLVSSGKIETVIQGREKVLAELKSRGESGESFGGDSEVVPVLLKSVEALNSAPGDVIFAIGPPHYRASGDSRRKLLRALWDRGVRLFYSEMYITNQPAPLELQVEAEKSGGGTALWHSSFRGLTLDDLRQLLVNEMYRFQLVTFTLPATAQPAAEVQVRYSGPRKSVTAAAPKYAVCGPVPK